MALLDSGGSGAMHRRTFVRLLTALASARAAAAAAYGQSPTSASGQPSGRSDLPRLKIVSSYAAAKVPGMPGPFPGRVIAVKSEKSVDIATGAADDAVVREMMAAGMLTRGACSSTHPTS